MSCNLKIIHCRYIFIFITKRKGIHRMDYGWIILMSVVSFTMLNAAPLAGAWMLAGKIACNCYSRWALTGFIFMIESLLICGGCGAAGALNLQGAIISSVTLGIAVILLAHKLKQKKVQEQLRQDHPKKSYPERLIESMLWIIGLFVCIKSAYLPGTDTMLYHLYYPAMWIDAGRFFAIPMQGLPHEYFPICGEVLYTWLLFGAVEPTVAPLLQTAATVMALLAMAGLWKTFQIPDFYIKAGILLLIASSIIIENVSMCYTDTLTGALLLTGTAFLIQGFYIKEQNKLSSYTYVLAGSSAMGLCAAIKYSGLVLSPVITLLMLIVFMFDDWRRKELAVHCRLYIAAVLAAIVSAGIFYLPNFLKTGNPFYPVKIPFLFSNGVEFDRPTVKPGELYSFFVNDNAWSMNIFSALLFLLLPLAALLAAWQLRRKNSNKAELLTALSLILVFSEIIMLLIYPAMTQARQIIPYLMALAILFPPVLQQLFPDLECNCKKSLIAVVAILLICILTASNPITTVYLYLALISIAAGALLAIFRSRKGVMTVNILFAAAIAFMLFFCWYMRWAFPETLLAENTSPAIVKGIMQLRSDYKTAGKPLKIASCGSWFNYRMLLDMPGNQVHCVPVNTENTLSAHQVDDVKKLREPAVDYAVWLKRLQESGFTHLVIQLNSHQDYGLNRDLELEWALRHPENFTLFSSDKNVYFFSIKY